MKKTVVQFCPWIDCKSGCVFCTNRGQPDVKSKAESLQMILKLLKASEVERCQGIGLIGGEFFQTQLRDSRVHNLFYEVLESIVSLVSSSKTSVNTFWLATSLLFDPKKFLFPALDHIESILDRTLLCTSYDTAYRFVPETKHDLWCRNMCSMFDRYPQMRRHVEILLTEDFMQKCLAKKFDLYQFEETFKAHVDFLEPHNGYQNRDALMQHAPLFLPHRKTFLRFLLEWIPENLSAERQHDFLNPKIRSEVGFFVESGRIVRINERSCKSLSDQTKIAEAFRYNYCDSDQSMVHDAREVLNSF